MVLRKNRMYRRTLTGWVVMVSLSGCTMAPHIAAPDLESRLPGKYDGAETHVDPAASVEWWRGFGDRTLNALIDSAIVRNLDLRVASARVLEVQETYRITRSALFPRIQAAVDGNRQVTPTNTGVTGEFSESIPALPDRFDVTTYSASLGLSYEVDFWGKARAASQAAVGEFVATTADFQTARIGVISETIATYSEIRDASRQLELARENVQLLGERVEITDDRYRRGLVTSFELYTIRQSLDDLRASPPLLESALYEAKGRLAVLLGTVPADVEALLSATENDYALPREIPVGLPSDLLRERPDIVASAARLESARQRIGVARAERFPSISLTASGGTQSNDLASLVNTSQSFWLLGGSLLAPVFNAGAINAEVRAAWARYEQVAAAYEKTVLTAFKEASSALVEHDAQIERLGAIRGALYSASASADIQFRRYRRGIGDYLALLDAGINELRAQANVSGALRAVTMARLGVHRALGGAWVTDSTDMAVSTQKKEFQQ